MPTAIIAILLFIGVFLFVAFALPILAVNVATGIIGDRAKISEDEKFKLKLYFYFVTGAFVGLGISITSAEGPISFVFNALLAALIWPLGFTLQVTGSFDSEEGSSLVMYGSVFLGFVVTQLLAVRMILKRADKDTNLDLD